MEGTSGYRTIANFPPFRVSVHVLPIRPHMMNQTRSMLRTGGEFMDNERGGSDNEPRGQAEDRRKLAIVAFMDRNQHASSGLIGMLPPLLAEQYDCELITENTGEPSGAAADDTKPVRTFAGNDPERAMDGGKTLYVLQNTGQLSAARGRLVRRPGIVLLETFDRRTAGAALGERRAEADGEEAAEAEAEAADWRKNVEAFIVHDEEAAVWLWERGLERVFVCSRPIRLPIMVTALTKPELVFALLGGVRPGAGAEQAIRCMAKLAAAGWNVRLWAEGAYAPEYGKRLRDMAEAFAIADRFELTGALAPEQYARRISGTDICLQRSRQDDRGPGEGLLRALSYGKPAVVNAAPAYLDIPNDAVLKLAPGPDEETKLLEALLTLANNRQLRNRLRRRARAYVSAEYSPQQYANRIAGLIADGDGLPGPDAVGERPTGEAADAGAVLDAQTGIQAEAQPEAPVSKPAATKPLPWAPAVPPPESPGDVPAGEPPPDLELWPSQYRRVRKGKAVECYFSFDFAGLPSGATIRSAVMHIPARGRQLRVHRISAAWSPGRAPLRKPRVRPKPIHSQRRRSAKGTAVLQWDCTELARGWQSGAIGNFGLYASAVSAVRQPRLLVELAGRPLPS